MSKWTIDDQVSLTGRNGKYALARALAKHNRLRARAKREAIRSTKAHKDALAELATMKVDQYDAFRRAAWETCERTDCVPVTDGSEAGHLHDEVNA